MSYHPEKVTKEIIAKFLYELLDTHVEVCDESDGVYCLVDKDARVSCNFEVFMKKDNDTIKLLCDKSKKFYIKIEEF